MTMTSMSGTSAPTGLPGAGSADLRLVGAAPIGTALPGCGSARLRAAEAFSAPYRGTGLPFAGPALTGEVFGCTPVVVDVVTRDVTAPEPAQLQNLTTHDDGTTLGIHTSTRPPG